MENFRRAAIEKEGKRNYRRKSLIERDGVIKKKKKKRKRYRNKTPSSVEKLNVHQAKNVPRFCRRRISLRQRKRLKPLNGDCESSWLIEEEIEGRSRTLGNNDKLTRILMVLRK